MLCDEVFADGTSGKRHREFGEAHAIPSDENLAERVLLLKDAMDRQRVEKLVGEETARRNASGNFDGRAATPFLDEAREASSKLVAAGRRALDRNVAKGVVKLRKLGLRKFEDVAGEPAHASASFDEKKFGGTIELLPHFGELASQQAAK